MASSLGSFEGAGSDPRSLFSWFWDGWLFVAVDFERGWGSVEASPYLVFLVSFLVSLCIWWVALSLWAVVFRCVFWALRCVAALLDLCLVVVGVGLLPWFWCSALVRWVFGGPAFFFDTVSRLVAPWHVLRVSVWFCLGAPFVLYDASVWMLGASLWLGLAPVRFLWEPSGRRVVRPWWVCVVAGGSDPITSFLLWLGGSRALPPTAHLCARPRRRARWVRQLEQVLGPATTVGQFVGGRWTPDLPSGKLDDPVNMLLARRATGVKLLGEGSVVGEEGDTVRYCIVEHPTGEVDFVVPSLISSLSAYSCFRVRESTLVSALRSRALDWCKKRGLPSSFVEAAVPSAVSWSWEVSPSEVRLAGTIQPQEVAPWWA